MYRLLSQQRDTMNSGTQALVRGEIEAMQTMMVKRNGNDIAEDKLSAAIIDSSLGPILVVASLRGICHIQFGDRDAELRSESRIRFPEASKTIDQDFSRWLTTLGQHIDAPQSHPTLPLDVSGTPFQRVVWEALANIPLGQTRTYAEVAQQIGRPKAVRAVARACATNEIAVLIPCHRVLRSDGGVGGYRWGVERKQRLLQLEASATQPD